MGRVNREPRGFDCIISPKARADYDALGRGHALVARRGMRELLRDPTTDNPKVRDATLYWQQPGEHLLRWNDVVVIYRFLNELVTEVVGIEVRPMLGPGPDA